MISVQLKNEAKSLRKKGYSIREISERLHISKSTLSLLLRDIVLSESTKLILQKKKDQGRVNAINTIVNKRKKREAYAIKKAEEIVHKISLNDVTYYLLASSLYECEGGKSNFGVLEFTNSDPVLVKIFLSSLRKAFLLDESKFRVVMHLHSYHNENSEKIFWSKVTGIKEVKFLKTFKKQESGINKKDNYHGCVQIKYFDVSIKRILLAGKVLLAGKMGL